LKEGRAVKVHVVTSANRALYASELEQMHRLRHRVFVEELGWLALTSPDGIERDEFDDEESAVYLIACENGRVYGSVRLLPTWRRCMLTECWPEWVARESSPIGPAVWEWTRWCPGTVHDRRHLVKARSALIVAALEFAHSRAVKTYITFCEVKFMGQLEELGWRPEPLGLPRGFDEGTAIGVRWAVTPGLLAATRKLLRVTGSASLEAPAPADNGVHIEPLILERLFALRNDDDAAAIRSLLERASAANALRVNGNSVGIMQVRGNA
jgi:N-acyl-L-homoserine lactone synthetase